MRFYTFLFVSLLTSTFLSAQQDRDYYGTVNSDTVYEKLKINKTDFNLTTFKKPGEEYQSVAGNVTRFYDAVTRESYVRVSIVKDTLFYMEEIVGTISLLLSAKSYYLVDNQGEYAEAVRDKKLSALQYGAE